MLFGLGQGLAECGAGAARPAARAAPGSRRRRAAGQVRPRPAAGGDAAGPAGAARAPPRPVRPERCRPRPRVARRPARRRRRPRRPAAERAAAAAGRGLHQLLREWNDTRREYPRQSTLAGLFAAQARSRPAAVALVAGAESLTYGELDGARQPPGASPARPGRRPRGAGRVCARALAPGGGGAPGHPQGGRRLRAARSRLPAGAPGLHAGRLRGALDRLGSPPRGGAGRGGGPGGRLVRILELDTAAAALAVHSDAAPATPGEDGGGGGGGDGEDRGDGWGGSADNLAYVMYTSGSTGRPKGVAVTHRGGGAAGARQPLRRPGGAGGLAGETLLQLAPIAFDASTLEIWGALLNGGRLALLPPTLALLARARRAGGAAAGDHAVADRRPLPPAGRGRARRPAASRQLLAGGDVLLGAARRAGARRAARLTPDQRLRPDREHHLHLLPPVARRAAAGLLGADRPADRQHPRLRARPAAARRCRSACPASCASAAPAWRAATSAGRS